MLIIGKEKKSNHVLSEHFSLNEFKCKCSNAKCSITLVAIPLVNGLQFMRSTINQPVHVLSGFRCPEHDAAVGGALFSMHQWGFAADITTSGEEKLNELLSAAHLVPEIKGIGENKRDGKLVSIHVDVRFGDSVSWVKDLKDE